jgi:probable rRNA maturation factor
VKIEWITRELLPEEIIHHMETVAEKSILCEGLSLSCSVSVRLCSDEEIRSVNARFRNIDKSTDVLSFPSVAFPKGKTARLCEKMLKNEYDDESSSCFLGDIIISVPHVIAQAQEYGHSVMREACYLLAHGMCHLMGYDHMQEDEKRIMREMEEKILFSSGIK